MAGAGKIHLGDLLVKQGLICLEQLMEAMQLQRQSGRKLGRVLLECGFVTEDELSGAIAHQLRIPMVDLQEAHARPEVAHLLPEPLARRFRAVAMEHRDDRILLAMADPTDLLAYDEIRRCLGRDLELAVANESGVSHCIDHIYYRSA